MAFSIQVQQTTDGEVYIVSGTDPEFIKWSGGEAIEGQPLQRLRRENEEVRIAVRSGDGWHWSDVTALMRVRTGAYNNPFGFRVGV